MARPIVFNDLPAAPWKNGGGSTTELAVFPGGAGFDDFDWRISVATISRSGAFSAFPGIDRSLALVDGESLLLDVDGAAVRLDGTRAMLSFAGETPVSAMVAAATTDFNVMTRRDRCRHEVERLIVTDAPLAWRRRGTTTLLFLARGEHALVDDGAGLSLTLARHDALLFGAADAGVLSVSASEGAIILIVELFTD